MARYRVTWHTVEPDGATARRNVRVYYLNSASERAARDSARDILKNAGYEPDGYPTVERVPDGV